MFILFRVSPAVLWWGGGGGGTCDTSGCRHNSWSAINPRQNKNTHAMEPPVSLVFIGQLSVLHGICIIWMTDEVFVGMNLCLLQFTGLIKLNFLFLKMISLLWLLEVKCVLTPLKYRGTHALFCVVLGWHLVERGTKINIIIFVVGSCSLCVVLLWETSWTSCLDHSLNLDRIQNIKYFTKLENTYVHVVSKENIEETTRRSPLKLLKCFVD